MIPELRLQKIVPYIVVRISEGINSWRNIALQNIRHKLYKT